MCLPLLATAKKIARKHMPKAHFVVDFLNPARKDEALPPKLAELHQPTHRSKLNHRRRWEGEQGLEGQNWAVG